MDDFLRIDFLLNRLNCPLSISLVKILNAMASFKIILGKNKICGGKQGHCLQYKLLIKKRARNFLFNSKKIQEWMNELSTIQL